MNDLLSLFRLSIFCLKSNLYSSPKASQTKIKKKKNVPQLLLVFFYDFRFKSYEKLWVVDFAAFLSLFITIFSADEIKATENFPFGQLPKHKPILLDICYFAKKKTKSIYFVERWFSRKFFRAKVILIDGLRSVIDNNRPKKAITTTDGMYNN